MRSTRTPGPDRTRSDVIVIGNNWRVVVVALVVVLAGCGSTSIDPGTPTGSVTPTPSQSGPPAPAPSVVGPAGSAPLAAQAATVADVLRTMTSTTYQHHYVVNASKGVYDWDCVGMTDWVLRQSYPALWSTMHTELEIAKGYVPAPAKLFGYLKSGPANWRAITRAIDVQAGDLIVLPPNPTTRFVGHALIAMGPALFMSDGSAALLVADSTGSPHGPYDSRLTDPRNINKSGTGTGTVRLFVDATGSITEMAWSVAAGGPRLEGVPVIVTRPGG